MEKGKRRNMQMRRRVLEHRLSILLISGVVVILAIVLSVASVSLYKKWDNQEEQMKELQEEKKEQEARKEEIDELEEHVGTDEYIEDTARETGLVYPNEILFEAE